jgi:hypothetical protein
MFSVLSTVRTPAIVTRRIVAPAFTLLLRGLWAQGITVSVTVILPFVRFLVVVLAANFIGAESTAFIWYVVLTGILCILFPHDHA